LFEEITSIVVVTWSDGVVAEEAGSYRYNWELCTEYPKIFKDIRTNWYVGNKSCKSTII